MRLIFSEILIAQDRHHSHIVLMILKLASKTLQRLSVIVIAITLILCVLSCGVKRTGEMRSSRSGEITGYVHVTDIQGTLGTRALSRPGALSLDPSNGTEV